MDFLVITEESYLGLNSASLEWAIIPRCSGWDGLWGSDAHVVRPATAVPGHRGSGGEESEPS